MLTLSKFKSDLKSLGIEKGDTLHIHSAMRTLGPIEKDFDGVVEVFRNIVGENGIFSVPTHSWNIVTKKQPVFHIDFTPSNLGAFPNHLLKGIASGSDFKRSLHPTHSMVACGDEKESFLETDLATPCPPKSSYGKLIERKGKVVLLGVNLNKCTFFHCLEEMAGLGDIWSLEKVPVTYYVFDSKNNRTDVDFRIHHDCISEWFYKIENDLLDEKILTQGFAGPAPVKILDAAKAADWLIPRFKKDPLFFVRMRKQ